jgi:hypothetical protein
MLFLSITLAFNLFASSIEESKVDKLIKNYIQQAAKGEIKPIIYTKNYKDFVDGDREVFAPCKKNKCKIATQLTKVDNNSSLWLARLKVTWSENKKLKTIPHRQGCYYIKNLQMYAYVEDCDTR